MGGSTPLDVCALPVEKLGEHMFNSAVVHFVTAGQVPIIGGAGAQNAVRPAKGDGSFRTVGGAASPLMAS